MAPLTPNGLSLPTDPGRTSFLDLAPGLENKVYEVLFEFADSPWIQRSTRRARRPYLKYQYLGKRSLMSQTQSPHLMTWLETAMTTARFRSQNYCSSWPGSVWHVPADYHESTSEFYTNSISSIIKALANYSEDNMTYDRTNKHRVYFVVVAGWVKDFTPNDYATQSRIECECSLPRQIPWKS